MVEVDNANVKSLLFAVSRVMESFVSDHRALYLLLTSIKW